MIPREKSKSKCEVRNQEKILPGRKISQFSHVMGSVSVRQCSTA